MITRKNSKSKNCPKNQPKTKIGNELCAGQSSKIAGSTADLQKTMANAGKGDITNQMAASGVNVQGVTNNFDANTQALGGMLSVKSQMILPSDEQMALASSMMMASTNALSCQVASVCNDTNSQTIVELDQSIDL